ncbi:MAG: enoyl-CoA hydratase-related protein [Candidatus Competibacteraceae bacterium]
MSSTDTVLHQQTAGIARITLNRPEALNALNPDLLHALAALLDRIRADEAQWKRSYNLTTYKQLLIRPERSGRSCQISPATGT